MPVVGHPLIAKQADRIPWEAFVEHLFKRFVVSVLASALGAYHSILA